MIHLSNFRNPEKPYVYSKIEIAPNNNSMIKCPQKS